MQDFREYFRGKKITVMGLGLLGRGIGDAVFLAERGAKLTITDIKSKEQLRESLKRLKKFKNITYVLGKHNLEDFQNCDLVLKNPAIPLDSIYIKEARENNIPVEMSATLFSKLSGLPMVAVTGTRGKSTVTHLIAHILKSSGKKIILGGNVRGVSSLQLLKDVKNKDVAVFELDSWQLQGFGDSKISPHISVFTNFFPDHMGYYKGSMRKYFSDKSHIFNYQKNKDVLIVGKQAVPFIEKWGGKIKSKITVPKEQLPKDWKFNLPGLHNEYNATLAIEVARSLSIPEAKIKKALRTFTSLSGRLEFLRSLNGVKIYNDNSSTTQEATIAALRAVGDLKMRKVVLIIGGDNKFLNMSGLLREIPKFCSKVVLFKERGTDLIRDKVFKFKKRGIEVYEEKNLQNTVRRAFSVAKSGETILYSPAFFSFGKHFKNEFDRGDQFVKIVKNLK
ncbi:MAG TPA: UDP-N-acetylmuramoyl-L-alanine--D-glutamate ligase [Candidatus Paceibacterota bacterium]|jgi:UDP-N-acetylmuramoylalanine--D-glutamate ligase|nr:UDP-N-acetylmuramoyl-L-alanine--D-glutamate ligase [Candidatus Paceibacterota bacterium]